MSCQENSSMSIESDSLQLLPPSDPEVKLELHVSDTKQIIKFIEFEKILTEQFCDYRYFRRKENQIILE